MKANFRALAFLAVLGILIVSFGCSDKMDTGMGPEGPDSIRVDTLYIIDSFAVIDTVNVVDTVIDIDTVYKWDTIIEVDTITIYEHTVDTVIKYVPTYIYDTTWVELPPDTIFDTMFIEMPPIFIYDTTWIELPPDTIFDTTWIELPPDTVFDTTIVTNYDTIFDTTIVTEWDTVFDTTIVTKWDTLFDTTIVHDTLWMPPDTVWMPPDTIFDTTIVTIHDTTYIEVTDTLYLPDGWVIVCCGQGGTDKCECNEGSEDELGPRAIPECLIDWYIREGWHVAYPGDPCLEYWNEEWCRPNK